MEQQSQSQKSKVCQTCRRELPVNYFGILKSSSDCYNYTCKECRNYRRRQAYKKTEDFEYIPPLRDHNDMILNLIQTNQLLTPVKSIMQPSGEKIDVTIEKSPTGITVTASNAEKMIASLQFSDMNLEIIKPYLHDFFFKTGIRLVTCPRD